MMMPGRKFSAGNSYRYGFNGKELDKEDPIQYDYGFRIYDPRLGRFKSVDPLTNSYPWNSTYAFAENDVLRCIDLDGKEKYVVTGRIWTNSNGVVLKNISVETLKTSGPLGNGTYYDIDIEPSSRGPLSILPSEINKIKGYSKSSEEQLKSETKVKGNAKGKHYGYGGIAFYAETGQGEETRIGSFDDLEMVESTGILGLGKIAGEVGTWETVTEEFHNIEDKKIEKEENKKASTENITSSSPTTSTENTKQTISSKKQSTKPIKSSPTFVFQREDNYATEKKRSLQNHAYVSDTMVSYHPSNHPGGVDTFHIKKVKNFAKRFLH